ncbi:MAG: radical SAM protein [Alphaproteobacteria bacterium]|nr:radical SAM protein [Alphaproteobacteria bacterium]
MIGLEMRRKKLVRNPLFTLRTRLIDKAARMVPVAVYRRLMESRFINFGVETTNICNADCTFCGYRFMERRKTVMEWELYEKAIREFADNGGGSINFTPTVGDPLVDKHIIRKIRHARAQPSITSAMLYTNGILLHRFGLDELLTSGLTRLAISTYIGSREGYKHYYGKDKYETVVRNIDAIGRRNKELGSPVLITLHLRIARDEADWKQTEEYRRFEDLFGGSNISFLESYDAWSGRIQEEDLPTGCEISECLPVSVKKKSPCFELYRRLHVLADGNVGACICTDLESEIKIGNIKEQSLQEIWQGERLAKYRSDWLNGDLPEVCKTCTRYTPVEQFIAENPKRILVDYLRRVAPWLFAARRRMQINDNDY